MVQKFYAVKDERVIRTAAVVTTIFATVVVFSAYFNGALAHLFFDKPPLINGKVEFDLLIPTLLKAQIPQVLMAVILLLVLSASMSTLSSLVLVSASAVAIDLYKGQVRPEVSRRNALVLMRVLSGLFIVLSYLIARFQIAVIVTLMSLSWGTVAGSFMAPFLYGLYWRKTTRAGVGAGMVTGLVLAIGLFFILGPARSPIASTIAMIVPFAVVPLVSAFTRPPEDQLLDRAFAGIGARF
jgi:SSS family solute:Na+ symporter